MSRAWILAPLVVATSLVASAADVTEEDFELLKTRNLLNLCAVSADDPRHAEAIHFCHGFMVGAYDYHHAAAGPENPPLVCFPEETVTRNEAVEMFVAWLREHPQYMDERPVDTEFRFLVETWPCKR